MFPARIVENFYVKTRNSIEEGRTKAPFGFVIPVQRDMTQRGRTGRASCASRGSRSARRRPSSRSDGATYPAGSYVIKRDQPYGRLAKNLLEKQVYPDARLTTYDDSGWTMGLLMLVDVKEIADAADPEGAGHAGDARGGEGKVAGSGTAGLAVAHYGSNNMIAFRYRLKPRR